MPKKAINTKKTAPTKTVTKKAASTKKTATKKKRQTKLPDVEAIVIAGTRVSPGEQACVDIPLSPLYSRTPMNIPVHVIHGTKPGPTLAVTAAIHGDELNGVDIIRRVLKTKGIKDISGTLLAVPIINVFGFIYHSRYLPDRRDLNRSFPGSKRGSLAARLANLIAQEILSKSTHLIDLHTAAIHRSNLPQIRADLGKPEVLKLARAFGTTVLVNSPEIPGSMRHTASEKKIPSLVYEAGEALRLDEFSIRAGLKGVLSVMRMLKMLNIAAPKKREQSYIAHSSTWARADHSGLLLSSARLGKRVLQNERLGIIVDPITGKESPVLSPFKGIVIGKTHQPLINEGEAAFHIARFEKSSTVEEKAKKFAHEFLQDSDPDHPFQD